MTWHDLTRTIQLLEEDARKIKILRDQVHGYLAREYLNDELDQIAELLAVFYRELMDRQRAKIELLNSATFKPLKSGNCG